MKKKILAVILIIIITLLGTILADPDEGAINPTSVQPTVELQVSPPSE